MNKISQAEKEIAKILQKFEIDSGCIVDTVMLKDVAVAKYEDNVFTSTVSRRVLILTRSFPGSDWGAWHEA